MKKKIIVGLIAIVAIASVVIFGGGVIGKEGVTLSPVTIEIIEPKDGVTVYDNPVTVTGTVKNFTNDDLSLWACVKSYDGIWYPQTTLTMIGDATWEADTKPGFPTNKHDIGKKFRIVILSASNEADNELRKPLRGIGDIADGWGLSTLPEGIKILDEITVIRGKSEVPGFEVVFAIAGLLAVAYLLRKRRR
jgi:PGF-CTERM protein